MADAEWERYKRSRIEEIRAAISRPAKSGSRTARSSAIKASRLPDGGRMLTYFDHTNSSTTEGALRRHLAAMEAAMDGMAILSAEGVYEYLNAAHLRTFGYSECVKSSSAQAGAGFTSQRTAARSRKSPSPPSAREGRCTARASAGERRKPLSPRNSLTAMEGGGLDLRRPGHHRAPCARGSARRRQEACAKRQAGPSPFPGQHEPRGAHPSERSAGLYRADARRDIWQAAGEGRKASCSASSSTASTFLR